MPMQPFLAMITPLTGESSPPMPPGGGERPPWWPGAPTHPIVPRPEHPIVLPPVEPGGPPVDIGRPGDPHPEHPIVLPPPPAGGAIKPPPPGGGWAYVNQWGWGYFPAGQSAGPK